MGRCKHVRVVPEGGGLPRWVPYVFRSGGSCSAGRGRSALEATGSFVQEVEMAAEC